MSGDTLLEFPRCRCRWWGYA